MINLMKSPVASPLVSMVPIDPGTSWYKEALPAIDAPPDEETTPLPEARWPTEAARSGIGGAVSPRVVALPGSGYRLYYTQILPRPGFPAGANDYDQATTRILSAYSPDGSNWTPEPGVRLSAHDGGAGEFRVASSEVVPIGDGTRLRMYYECCPGPQSLSNSIRSANSDDGGLTWTPEVGTRLATEGHNYSAPRIVFLENGQCRLYCNRRGHGIISALSDDGLTFRSEKGVRISQDGAYDSHAAFAPEIVRLTEGGYVMYYAGYSSPERAYVVRAVSHDGLTWHKESAPVVAPGPGGIDAAKCSEMCLVPLPRVVGGRQHYRLLYEACDGTATNQRGVWRIASAVSAT